MTFMLDAQVAAVLAAAFEQMVRLDQATRGMARAIAG